jgi:hypothetical protein
MVLAGRRAAPFTTTPPPRQRSPKGTGSLREIRPGVWQLAVIATDGSGRRYRRIDGTRDDATAALAGFAVETGGRAATVEALALAYLACLQTAGRSPDTLRRYRQLWPDWLGPPPRQRRTRRAHPLPDRTGPATHGRRRTKPKLDAPGGRRPRRLPHLGPPPPTPPDQPLPRPAAPRRHPTRPTTPSIALRDTHKRRTRGHQRTSTVTDRARRDASARPSIPR